MLCKQPNTNYNDETISTVNLFLTHANIWNSSSQWITGKASLIDWADETVGGTHIGKRKQKTKTKKGKGKKIKESAWKRWGDS
jgi:hypothetical protein